MEKLTHQSWTWNSRIEDSKFKELGDRMCDSLQALIIPVDKCGLQTTNRRNCFRVQKYKKSYENQSFNRAHNNASVSKLLVTLASINRQSEQAITYAEDLCERVQEFDCKKAIGENITSQLISFNFIKFGKRLKQGHIFEDKMIEN